MRGRSVRGRSVRGQKCERQKCERQKCEMQKCERQKCEMQKCERQKCERQKCERQKCERQKCVFTKKRRYIFHYRGANHHIHIRRVIASATAWSCHQVRPVRYDVLYDTLCVCVCRYKAAGILRLYNKLVTLRLLWALDHVPGLREAANKGGGYHDKVAIQ